METFTQSGLFYIKCCVENLTVTEKLSGFFLTKNLMMSEVQPLIRTFNFAFKLRDSSLCSTARAKLSRDIKQAKEAYRRIQDLLTYNNL